MAFNDRNDFMAQHLLRTCSNRSKYMDKISLSSTYVQRDIDNTNMWCIQNSTIYTDKGYRININIYNIKPLSQNADERVRPLQ